MARIVPGTNITLTKDAALDTLTVAAASSSAGIADFAESVDDRVNALVVAGTGVTKVYDDVANTLTLASTTLAHAHPSSDVTDFAEGVDDRVAALIVAGAGVTKVYDDVANTLTLSSSSGLDAEGIDDRVAALIIAGAGISKVYDDVANTLTIAVSKETPASSFIETFEAPTLDPAWTISAEVALDTTTFSEGAKSLKLNGATAPSVTRFAQISRTVTAGATITFARRTSSETNFDKLRFFVDSVFVAEWSGEVPWSDVGPYTLAAGARVLRWEYVKDGSANAGSDAAWIDNVRVVSPAAVDEQSWSVVIGVAGTALAGGEAVSLEVPFACTLKSIRAWSIASGSATVNVDRATYAGLPTFGNLGSLPLVATNKAEDTNIADWIDTTLDAGDWLRFVIAASPTTVDQLHVAIRYTRGA